jgi:hypothetical protein
MSSLKDLDEALKKASVSEKSAWGFILDNIVIASVEGVKNPMDAKKLLDGLEKVHSHLINAETIIQTYEDLKMPGFSHENVEALKRELQVFSKKVNLDIQALKQTACTK